MKTKIAIVDDHRIIRDGIKALLLGDQNFEMVFEAATGEILKKTIGNTCPDLVLLDIILPDISGLDLISFFKENYHCKVLMLTAEMDEEIVCEAIGRGADGFSFKEIGTKLFISPRTVENHKNNLLEKLELRNTIELIKFAIKNNIISL